MPHLVCCLGCLCSVADRFPCVTCSFFIVGSSLPRAVISVASRAPQVREMSSKTRFPIALSGAPMISLVKTGFYNVSLGRASSASRMA